MRIFMKALVFLMLLGERKKEKRFSLLKEEGQYLMNNWLTNSYFCREFVKMSPSFELLSNRLEPLISGLRISVKCANGCP